MKIILHALLLLTGPLVALSAHALSFGDIKSRSFLMEPLVVEVPITQAHKDEIESLQVEVAGPADFQRLGLERTAIHDQVRFAIVQRGGSWLVEIRSRDVIREPYFALPLQATWRGGQYVREYTVFLDPRSVSVAAQAQARTRKATDQPKTEPNSRTVPSPAPASKREFWPVRRGETLWNIADQVRPLSVTTYQMMMALLRANPDAFPDGNVNNLKAGARLRIPEIDVITRLSARKARQEFKAQTDQWRGEVEMRTPTTTPDAPETAAAPKADSAAASTVPEAAAEPKKAPEVEKVESQLRIVAQKGESKSTPELPSEIAEIENQVLLAMEQTEADRLELRTLNKRVEEIQAEMMRMRRLLILKNEQITALQAAKDNQPLPPRVDIDAVAPRPEVVVKQPAETPPDRPVVAAVPAPDVSPSKPTPDFQWWLWLATVAMALAVIAIVAMMIRRRDADDVVLDDPSAVGETDDRPHADGVARYTPGRRDAVAVPATGAGLSAPKPVGANAAADDDGYAEALAEWDGHARSPIDTRESAAQEEADESMSDEELAALARDLGGTDSSGFEPLRRSGYPTDDPDDGYHDLDFDLESAAASATPETRLDRRRAESEEDDKDILKLRLELAQAYLEIGDVEGAKDILAQVVEEGMEGPEQAEARKLLESLG